MTKNPTTIERLQRQLSQAITESFPDNTRRAYAAAMRSFTRWAAENGINPLPAQPEHIAAYLYHLNQQGKSLSAVNTARSAIAKAHTLTGIQPAGNPAKSAIVAQTVKTIRRINRQPPRQSKPLMPEDLTLILETAAIPRTWQRGDQTLRESETAAQRRAKVDIALCLTMRDAALRRSEAAALAWNDVHIWPDGTGRITILQSKTNRNGPPETVAITTHAVNALNAIRPDRTAPGEKVFKLKPQQIGRRIAQAARQAGLGDGYSGHSGRVGLARIMSRNGAPVNATMQQGRWKSAQTVALYTRAEEAATALQWIS